VQRAGWKAREMARIAAMRHAPPTPIGPVLARAAAGGDVGFTRVAADCLPAPPAPAQLRQIAVDGDWIARALGACRLAGLPYDGIVVDRGLVTASRGSTTPIAPTLPAPRQVVGVLYARTAQSPTPPTGLARPASYTLVAERETPPAPGIVPTPYPDASGALEYVGIYAPTWFGLAGVLACVYAAMLWRRYHPKLPPPR
jgi:surfeit locus 1 family protein